MKPKPTKEADDTFQEQNEVAQGVATQNIAAASPAMNDSTIMAALSPRASILDLPDEVKKNIVGYEDLEMDEMILVILGSFNASISVDRIIQILWTLYHKSPKRTKVMGRLRMLSKAGEVEQVDGVRSQYRLLPKGLAAL